MPKHSLILYDGECAWCNSWLVDILRHDQDDLLRVGYIQDFKPLRQEQGLKSNLDSILLLHEGRWHVKSAAIYHALRLVDIYRPLQWMLRILPQSLSDVGYDLIAMIRYHIAGRHESCIIPDANLVAKHLTNTEDIERYLDSSSPT